MSDWISDGEKGNPVRVKLNSLHDLVYDLTGYTGTSGTSGSSGISGFGYGGFGGNSILYKFNNDNTLISPGSGYLKLNNSLPSLANKLIVDYRNLNGSFVDTWLRSISSNTSSYFRLFKENETAVFCIYKILGLTDHGIISKYVTFDIEIIYADDNEFFVQDDNIVLTYTESGSGSTSIIIPQLKLDTGFYTLSGSIVKKTDTLRCYWESADTNFLNYNPEIWTFRRKSYIREIKGSDWKMRHTKWTHEPHLNGIKFPGSAYYSGTIKCIVPEIQSSGIHTEFTLIATGSSYKQIIPLDPYEYIYGNSGETWIKLSDDLDYSEMEIKITGKRDSMSLALRFAVVIDNPNITDKNPKIIGPLSDVVYLRYGRNGGNGNVIKYFLNEIDVKMFGTGRWST